MSIWKVFINNPQTINSKTCEASSRGRSQCPAQGGSISSQLSIMYPCLSSVTLISFRSCSSTALLNPIPALIHNHIGFFPKEKLIILNCGCHDMLLKIWIWGGGVTLLVQDAIISVLCLISKALSPVHPKESPERTVRTLVMDSSYHVFHDTWNWKTIHQVFFLLIEAIFNLILATSLTSHQVEPSTEWMRLFFQEYWENEGLSC